MSNPLIFEEIQTTLQGIYTEEKRLYTTRVSRMVLEEESYAFYLDRLTLGRTRGELETALLKLAIKDLGPLLPLLKTRIQDLRKELDKLESFIQVMDTLGRLIGVMSRVVTLVAAPEVALMRAAVASPFAAMEGKWSFSSPEKKLRRGEELTPDSLMEKLSAEKEAVVASPVKNAVEEVLYGIELTPERLVITVATGGCTKKDSFHIHVNKGYTGLPPYQVTLYRVKPDDCKGNFEPIRISFSRKELGLEGAVDFTVLNRIGNTSQHRLSG